MLNEAQNAIAGWRRVLDIGDVDPDVADPGDRRAATCRRGPVEVRVRARPLRLSGRSARCSPTSTWPSPAQTRVAVVGETGSGKTTFAEAAHPADGPGRRRVLLSGVPLTEVRFESLRRRVVMVPQDGFLFDSTVAANVRFARPGPVRRRPGAGVHRARPGRLGRGAAGRPRHAGRRARRGAERGGAAAGRAGPRVRRRPRPARARRGDQRGRPGHRGAAAAHARRGDPRAARRSRSRTGSRPRRPPTT